jgi:uncharacterized repeat protein (TIGR01451 family)
MIAVTMDDATPETVRVGGDINYEITITNISSGNATGITLTSDLPTSVFLAFTPQSSQGTCAGSGIATVTCDLGSLTTGASANVFITATPTESGQITTTAIVSPGNEMATTTTTVEPAPETTVILPGLSTSINLGLLIQSMDQCVFKRNKPECTGLGLTLLQNKPGLTGELAAEFLRQQLAITCSTEGIATRNPLRCSPLFLFVLSELIAPPEVR